MASKKQAKNVSHWQLSTDDKGILWVMFDKQDAGTNVLSKEVLQQLDALLDDIRKELPTAVVFRSGKSNGFIAGADIKSFAIEKKGDFGRSGMIRTFNAVFVLIFA